MREMISLLAARLTGRAIRGQRGAGNEYLFERTRFGKLPTERIGAAGASPPAPMARRLDRIESAFADISELRLELPPRSWVSVTGGEADRYSLVLWVESADPSGADAIAERAELVREGDTLALRLAPDLSAMEAVFRWEIGAPRDRPVLLSGADAVVGVYDVKGPVAVSLHRGHVAVIGASGTTDITTRRGADVVWAGQAGTVTITSESDVALKLTDAAFAGFLRVSTERSIRLWLPRDFDSGIEADASHAKAIVCRATIVERGTREEHGRVVREYGGHRRQLHLASE